MTITIPYGRTGVELPVADTRLVAVHRQPVAPALADPAAAVRAALETPFHFPALRRALTPDDRVCVVVDERLPDVPGLLVPILEHLRQAHIDPEAVTLLCLPPSSGQPWLEALPEEFESVRVEVHDPHDRKRLSYLAATKQGRRVYLNRTAVDADQTVVLTRRDYDPLLGYGGAEGALYPALSDAATLAEAGGQISLQAPGEKPWKLRQEAAEVAWLLGTPFFVQVILGAGTEVAHVLGGPVDSSAEGRRLLDARWRVEVDEAAETVVATVGGGPRVGFAALAAALACAARVVRGNGRIVLLTEGEVALSHDVEVLQQFETPEGALRRLADRPGEHLAALQWAGAARQGKIFLLSDVPAEVAEEMFAVPLDHAGQVRRVVGDGSCLVLPDADRMLAVVRG